MLAIITGSAALQLPGEFDVRAVLTDYAPDPVQVLEGHIDTCPVFILQRHGPQGDVPAYKVPYLAQMNALEQLRVDSIVALHTVGGIAPDLAVSDLLLPDQIIDYTWGRAHTFDRAESRHIEFSYPFDATLRQRLLHAAQRSGVPVRDCGVYGCTQGPRLETAAEIRRMARDGCDVVGMTAMPEAALAREAGIAYASLAGVVNPAAGIEGNTIDLRALSAANVLIGERANQVLGAFMAAH